MRKSSRKYSKSNKRLCAPRYVSGHLIAKIVGCDPSLVSKVWKGERSNETKLGENIEVATLILEDGIKSAIVKTQKLINKSK